MAQDLLFHALLLLGILWLYRLLLWVWPWGHTTTCQTTSAPAKPITQRSKDPQPFPGLTLKPSCAACEDGAQTPAKAPLSAPSPIVPTRGCPRQVATSLSIAWGNHRSN